MNVWFIISTGRAAKELARTNLLDIKFRANN